MMRRGGAPFITCRRMKWILPWSIIIFLFVTYIGGWWTIHIEKETLEGQAKYKIKARIHVGVSDNQTALENENNLDEYRKVVELEDNTGRFQFRPGKKSDKVDEPLEPKESPNLKPTTSKNVTEGEKTSAKSLVIAPTAKLQINKVLDSGAKQTFAIVEDVPNPIVQEVQCTGLFSGDTTTLKKASQHQIFHPKHSVPDMEILSQAKNCDAFKKNRKYLLHPVNQEEADFPIAFSLLLFKDVEMVERLLRAVYRPQNFYCIHVDVKSSAIVRQAMEAIANCFDNVFMSSRSVDVQWGYYSVLEPEIICMEDLWQKFANKWKYFINLTGQEFPLRTNLELVKILKAYNGANNMETTIKRRNIERVQYVHHGIYPTNTKKEPCPVNVTISKGSVHITAQSGFVDFVLHNPAAIKFRNWLMDSGVPDETLFSSLNISPHLGVPGATTGSKETNKDTNPFLTRFKNWGTWPFDFPCEGRRVRMVCIFSIGDLPLLASRPELFANKFYPDYHPLAYDCMEERHYNRTRNEVLGNSHFHAEYYSQLEFVKHHLS